jgi:hypothetical protein
MTRVWWPGPASAVGAVQTPVFVYDPEALSVRPGPPNRVSGKLGAVHGAGRDSLALPVDGGWLMSVVVVVVVGAAA